MVKHQDVPKWLQSKISAEQAQKLSALVGEMEKQTSGEIVPVIVHRSSAVGHVFWVLIGFFMICFWAFEEAYSVLSWSKTPSWYSLGAFAATILLSFLFAKFEWVQRVLTPDADEAAQVDQRAQLEFFHSHIKKTAQGTGILIFVSWMERRAVILADEGISKHYPPETWNQVVSAMTQEFKAGRIYEGFEGAIRKCGEILNNKLPAEAHNKNELGNHLIIK